MLLLSVLLLLLMRLPSWGATYYIAPNGNDGNPGTAQGVAWQHFNFAVQQLRPGDTLLVLDGLYTTANSGGTVTGSTDILSVACGSGQGNINGVNGTPGNPITIKALNERKAELRASGRTVAYFWRCSYWNVEGLFLRNIDQLGLGGNFWEGGFLSLDQSDHFVVKRNLGYFTNTAGNSHGIALYNTTDTLVEENEVYAAGRHGIIQGHNLSSDNPRRNVVRRNYVNGRKHATIPGGFECPGSCDNNTGDEGISLYPGQDAIIENNIVEDEYTGMSLHGVKDNFNNRYYGNILGVEAGNGPFAILGMGARDGFPLSERQMIVDAYFENTVSYRGTYIGCGACKRLTFKNMTILNSVQGIFVGTEAGVGDGHTSITGQNILFMNGADSAYAIDTETFSFDYLRNYNNGDNSFPSGATHTSTGNPNINGCIVYIPDGSNLKGAGLGGADIGANVLYRYQDGALTTVPLWDTGTGAFPCGAIVAGINDVPGNSCFDVHQRLHVNTSDCPFPASYGGAPVVENLVAHWKFDEGAGTSAADATGHGHTGTLVGTALPLWGPGRIGPKALTFDGATAAVTVANASDLQVTNNLTLSAWIKPITAGGGQRGRILNKHGASSNTTGYSLHLADDRLNYAINALSGTTGVDDASTPSGTLVFGVWQHVAVTVSSGTVRFYRNGQLVSTTTLSTSALPSTVPFVIGGADTRTDRGFDGGIDDARIYNFALSGSDILFLYRSATGQARRRIVMMR
jgi:hypothetical protein